MKTWDTVVIGGGIVGLAIALELRRHGADVLVVERGEAGREASHAAAGMLGFCDPETPAALQDLCVASAALFPEFVRVLEEESGVRVDFRREGTIAIGGCSGGVELSADEVRALEPFLDGGGEATLLPEYSVDNRALVSAALKACRHRGVELASGSEVTGIEVEDGQARGVKTGRTRFAAATVVNCAGAWAGQVGPVALPTRPRKGQMLCCIDPDPHRRLLSHVVRGPEVYIVPRSDGRLVIGATVEDVGFDKRVEAETIQRLHQAAANLVPEIGEARMHDAWAGLRPGTPDDLPILGATEVDGYFVAAGHYRNGILLSAVTAKVMGEVIRGGAASMDVAGFSAARFGG